MYNIIMWEMGNNKIVLLNFVGEEGADIVRSLTIIAGGLLGALAVILLILVTAVGTVILVQKGIIFDKSISKLCHNMLFCMYRFTNLETDHKKEINVSYS